MARLRDAALGLLFGLALLAALPVALWATSGSRDLRVTLRSREPYEITPRPGEAPDAGGVSRAVYDPALAPAHDPGHDPRLQSRADGSLPPSPVGTRWKEPLWWAGAAAALGALALLWLARPGPTAPAVPGRSGPSVDLLASPPAAPAPPASGRSVP